MKNFKNYFSYLILFISFLLLFYLIYRSEFHYQGEKRDYYIHYYYLSVILVFFSILSFYFSQKFKTYLAIGFTSFFVAFYIFEIYFNYLNYKYSLNAINLESQKKNSIIFKNLTGNDYDIRSKVEIYEDIKKNNKKVAVTVGSIFHDTDSEKILTFSGVSNYQTIMCNENGYYAIYNSDRHGFNNPDDQWDKDVDFILIGDSFVHGGCVNRPNDIASNLRKFNLTGLNLGIGGNGPLTNFAILREYNVKNKNIIWFFYEGNDLVNLEREIQNKYLINYLKDSSFTQNLKLKQKLLNELILSTIQDEIKKDNTKRKIDYNEIFSRVIKLYYLRQFIFNHPKPEFEQILKLTKNFSQKNKSKLYFVYLPDFYTVKTNLKKGHFYKVKKIINGLDIPFIDIHEEVFKKEKEPLELFPFKQNGHYTEVGYEKISEVIFNFISK
tara:strand:+ start:4594 stop:5910 length:1317 start_codon:yes stop_codon:yes gene_type:complete